MSRVCVSQSGSVLSGRARPAERWNFSVFGGALIRLASPPSLVKALCRCLAPLPTCHTIISRWWDVWLNISYLISVERALLAAISNHRRRGWKEARLTCCISHSLTHSPLLQTAPSECSKTQPLLRPNPAVVTRTHADMYSSITRLNFNADAHSHATLL